MDLKESTQRKASCKSFVGTVGNQILLTGPARRQPRHSLSHCERGKSRAWLWQSSSSLLCRGRQVEPTTEPTTKPEKAESDAVELLFLLPSCRENGAGESKQGDWGGGGV